MMRLYIACICKKGTFYVYMGDCSNDTLGKSCGAAVAPMSSMSSPTPDPCLSLDKPFSNKYPMALP